MENKTSKYLKYAIGEIVLVVIGILIALQVNNLNEARKTKLQEKINLKNLVQDLKFDSISFVGDHHTLLDITKLYQQLYELGVNNDTIAIDNPNNIRRLPYYNPIIREKDPLTFGEISNDSIKKQLLNYLRAVKDMDDGYGEFADVIKNRMRVFLGDKNMYNLSGWFEHKDMTYKGGISQSFIKKENLPELSKTPEFQQLLLEASIKCNESIFALEALMEQNKKLIALIENSLSQ
jgi:hypothetical protein